MINDKKSPGKAALYKRLKTVSIDTVVSVILANIDTKKLKVRVEIDGVIVKVSSIRLRTFATRGTKCSCCGLKAEYFAFEKPAISKIKCESYHLNLWGQKDGEEILFTHDHTLARALGGADHIENTTTMCDTCNNQKSILEGEEYRSRKLYLDKVS